jgi:hypothetical protein
MTARDGLICCRCGGTPVWDSNDDELRQPLVGIGVVGLESAEQFHLSRKSVEIGTRNCLLRESLAFLN